MVNDFNSVLATCHRFQDIATWDPEHFNANGALARIAELHKRELAAKDAEIAKLKCDCGEGIGYLMVEQESVKKLKDCLKEAVIVICRICPLCDAKKDYRCLNHGSKCYVDKWRAALGKTWEEVKFEGRV